MKQHTARETAAPVDADPVWEDLGADLLDETVIEWMPEDDFALAQNMFRWTPWAELIDLMLAHGLDGERVKVARISFGERAMRLCTPGWAPRDASALLGRLFMIESALDGTLTATWAAGGKICQLTRRIRTDLGKGHRHTCADTAEIRAEFGIAADGSLILDFCEIARPMPTAAQLRGLARRRWQGDVVVEVQPEGAHR